jgi:hypothetical protein
MILRVLVGSAPRDDFPHLSLAQHSSPVVAGSYTPSVEALRITPPIAA